MHKGIGLTLAIALTAVVGTGSANAADKIKLGFFSTLEGRIPRSARTVSAASTLR